MFDSDLFRQTFAVTSNYRQINCYDLCLINHIADTCRCSETDCASNSNCTIREFGNYDIHQCGRWCPLECDMVTYQTHKHSNYFSINPVSKRDHEKLKEFFEVKLNLRNVSASNMEKRFLDLYVFNERTEETVISENAKMTLTELISSIGGIGGLFLGISLLSFVEILELIFEVLFIVLK
jgi:hypothetical protein